MSEKKKKSAKADKDKGKDKKTKSKDGGSRSSTPKRDKGGSVNAAEPQASPDFEAGVIFNRSVFLNASLNIEIPTNTTEVHFWTFLLLVHFILQI